MPANCDEKRLNAYETLKVKRFVDELFSSASLQQTAKRIMARENRPDSSPFERYAAMVLREGGADRLSEVSPLHALRLLQPEDGKLARISCAAKLAEDERAIVSNVENALNRLVGIADALEDGFVMNSEVNQGPRYSISIFGAAPLSTMPGYRSAYVQLPNVKLSDKPTFAYFNEVDWRVVDAIASNSHTIFLNFTTPNARQSIMGAYAPAWSDWDVRTRLASILESLELPFSFDYAFDCDTARQVTCVRFRMPASTALPALQLDANSGNLVPLGARASSALTVYAMRLSCLIAAACFGSGRHIEKAFVQALRDDADDVLVSCAFERDAYVRSALAAIDDGSFNEPALRFDIEGIVRMLEGCDIRYAVPDDAALRSVEPHDDGLDAQRVEPWLDERPLEPETKRLFRSDMISSVDCLHYHGPSALEIEEAKRDAADSIVAAIARLEGIVDELECATAPPGDDAGARPLYCANPYARVLVSLLDDSTAIGIDAEAYLNDDGITPIERQLPQFFRAPNALYHAHMGLSDLYEQLGDFNGAEVEANRCIMLAPTTVDAHFRKAHLLAQRGRFVEAANVICNTLPLAVTDDDCSLLYYHLGLLLWNLDRKNDAAAAFVFAATRGGSYAEKAGRIVKGLKRRADSPVIVHASSLAAARELKRARIPIAPTEDALDLVAHAAVGLACSHAPLAAIPYAELLVRRFKGDRVLSSVLRSLAFGKDEDAR